jgi:hypothetical protein
LAKSEIFVYCKTCDKKVKALILSKHEKEFDNDSKKHKRFGMVKVLQHDTGFRKKCSNTSQIKALVESDTTDENDVMN